MLEPTVSLGPSHRSTVHKQLASEVFLPAHTCPPNPLRPFSLCRRPGLHHVDDRLEAEGLVHREPAQHLPVQPYPPLPLHFDPPRVPDPVLPHSGVQPLDPEPAELPLLQLPVPVRVLSRPLDPPDRHPERPARPAPVPLGGLQDFLPVEAAGRERTDLEEDWEGRGSRGERQGQSQRSPPLHPGAEEGGGTAPGRRGPSRRRRRREWGGGEGPASRGGGPRQLAEGPDEAAAPRRRFREGWAEEGGGGARQGAELGDAPGQGRQHGGVVGGGCGPTLMYHV